MEEVVRLVMVGGDVVVVGDVVAGAAFFPSLRDGGGVPVVAIDAVAAAAGAAAAAAAVVVVVVDVGVGVGVVVVVAAAAAAAAAALAESAGLCTVCSSESWKIFGPQFLPYQWSEEALFSTL